jgi:hypothetical protein
MEGVITSLRFYFAFFGVNDCNRGFNTNYVIIVQFADKPGMN